VNAIVLLPLGDADRKVIADLQAPVERAFRLPVGVEDPHVDLEIFYDEQRVQYNSTAIISHLQQNPSLPGLEKGTENGSVKFLAVTSEYLFIPILTYVFGEAQLGGSFGVVSYHRLLNERYGLPHDEDVFRSRLVKECFHELGHIFGLLHCSSQDCVMHTSTYVEDIDIKGGSFCAACDRELHQKKHRQ
jgi:archaemetzincin